MTKKTRVIFEIDDKKLHADLKRQAKKERRNLKEVVISAFKNYLANPVDLQ